MRQILQNLVHGHSRFWGHFLKTRKVAEVLKKVVNLSRKISNSTVRENTPKRASAVRENRTPDGLKKPDFRPLHPTFAPGEQGQKVLRFRVEAPVLGHFGYSEGP